MTKRREILACLRQQKTDLLIKSAKNPNQFMSKFVILLHYVVLRERGLA